jgi:Ca2+-transporting ATPase
MTLTVSNVFLTLSNRSFYETVFKTIRYRNPVMLLMLFLTLAFLVISLTVQQFMQLFEFSPMGIVQVIVCVMIAFVSVYWMEAYKFYSRNK